MASKNTHKQAGRPYWGTTIYHQTAWGILTLKQLKELGLP